MPLVIVCGIPSCGKSRRAQVLADYLRADAGAKEVVLINDESLGISKRTGYGCK